jgi:hypothetical protein
MGSLASMARAKKKSLGLFTAEGGVPPQLKYYAVAFQSEDHNRAIAIKGRKGRRIFSYPIR